ncbi:VOC family protein [Jatrophihabitans fulvus]
MEFRLEAVVLPVTDVDRAKAFYERCGFPCDVDFSPGEGSDFRVVQFTPPGSHCSLMFGSAMSVAGTAPVRGMHLVVRDVTEAREYLLGRGVEVGEARHMTADGWQPGADPQHAKYNTFAEFDDPDGNGWVLQEVP